jgi:hypothetical protein
MSVVVRARLPVEARRRFRYRGPVKSFLHLFHRGGKQIQMNRRPTPTVLLSTEIALLFPSRERLTVFLVCVCPRPSAVNTQSEIQISIHCTKGHHTRRTYLLKSNL